MMDEVDRHVVGEFEKFDVEDGRGATLMQRVNSKGKSMVLRVRVLEACLPIPSYL